MEVIQWKKIRYIMSELTILFAVYGLVTQNFRFTPMMNASLGFVIFLSGLEELQKKNKGMSWFLFFTSAWMFYVSLQIFFSSY